MSMVLGGLAFALALGFAAVMGFAIQRGATCTVAAVDELVNRRSANRLAALVEAAVWVAGGLLVVNALDLAPRMPAGYAVSAWTVAGGVLLGLGAWINSACVFGAIALFGSGRWAQAAMPLGYFLGCASLQRLLMPMTPVPLMQSSPVLQAPAWAAAAFLLFAAWRLPVLRPARQAARPTAADGSDSPARRDWTPHAATIVIGITFFFSMMLAGAWAYTELLADLSRGRPMSVAVRLLLAVALLAGAVWGGRTAGRFKSTPVTARQLARSLVGGAMMGWGTLLIPGSNDGLILVGMPLLWPYAWVAFATMAATIAAAMRLSAR